MKVYQRTEDGAVTEVSVKDAMAEVNHAMMEGKNKVRRMSSGRGQHRIEYKNGRSVCLVELEATEEQAATEPREWSGTRSNFSHLHRFNDSNRARCNSRIRPGHCMDSDKEREFQTKSEVLAGEYAHLYTFCPRCDAEG